MNALTTGKTLSLLAAILVIASMSAPAQWLDFPVPGIPRLPNGKPNLSARAPRKPGGKPDLSGVWNAEPDNRKYFTDLAVDFKPGEFPIQPWAEALTNERRTYAHASERPDAHCVPVGVPQDYASGLPFKIIQEPGLVAMLFESFGVFRQIFLDGRKLPKDPNPTWAGYSVGRWEGEALVVETTGFNGLKWLDEAAGHPSTDALHFTERFRRRDFGHMDLLFTIDDPKAYTKPWSVSLPLHFEDTELLEFICNENEKDLKHMK